MGCLNNHETDIHDGLLNHDAKEKTRDFSLLSPQGIIEELMSQMDESLILDIQVNPDFLLVWEDTVYEGDRIVIQHFIDTDVHQTHSWEQDYDDHSLPLPLSLASVLVKYSENC